VNKEWKAWAGSRVTPLSLEGSWVRSKPLDQPVQPQHWSIICSQVRGSFAHAAGTMAENTSRQSHSPSLWMVCL